MTLYAVLAAFAMLVVFVGAIMVSARRAGRAAERLKTTERANEIKTRQLDAANRRPRNADELRERMRSGRF